MWVQYGPGQHYGEKKIGRTLSNTKTTEDKMMTDKYDIHLYEESNTIINLFVSPGRSNQIF